MLWMDVDTALSEVPVNVVPLTDDTDFKTREESVVYNQAGLDLVWNFVTTAGAYTQTAVTPTETAGDYDWTNQGNGMYSIEIPASGGASINNDTEGFGWFSGYATGILPWSGPIIGFRAAGLNNLLIDDAHSATRGLAGTALPAAAADAAGGLPISDAGGLDLDNRMPAAAAITNLNTVFDTDFATNYNATRNAWVTNVQDKVGTGNLPADLQTIKTQTVTCAAGVTIDVYVGSTGAAALEATAQAIETDTQNIQSRIPTALGANGNIKADVRDYNGVAGTFGLGLPSVNTTSWNGTAISSEIPTVLVSAGTGLGQLDVTSGVVKANLVQMVGVAQSATDLKDFADDGYDPDTNKVQGVVLVDTTTTNTDMVSAAPTAADVADAVWDEVITGANHNVNGSAARFVREGAEAAGVTGTAQAGAAGTITLAAGASTTSDIYNGERIQIIEGTGAGQSRLITDYDGGTKVATVDRNWTTNPSSDSLYSIQGADADLRAIEGDDGKADKFAASAGQIIIGTVDTVTNTHTPTTTEFQADDITEATADHYNGRIIIFTSGNLAGQATSISDYAAVGGIGQFTTAALTEAPANNDTFIIV